jgi:hypothetical protein
MTDTAGRDIFLHKLPLYKINYLTVAGDIEDIEVEIV